MRMTGNDMKPDIVYRVTKGNSDKSIFKNDLLFIDKKSGVLICGNFGCFAKDELVPSIMDFECKLAEHHKVHRTFRNIGIRKIE